MFASAHTLRCAALTVTITTSALTTSQTFAQQTSTPAVRENPVQSSKQEGSEKKAVKTGKATSSSSAQANHADRGVNAFEHGRFEEAVAFLQAVAPTERSAAQQLALARSRAQLGHWLESLDDYEMLLTPQSPTRALPGWQELRAVAEAEGAQLGRRLPWAKLDFGKSVPAGSSIFVDGHWVSPGRFQVPYPVNPGWHTFLLEVDGQVQAARRMYFEEEQRRSVRLVSSPAGPMVTPPSTLSVPLAASLTGSSDTALQAPLTAGQVDTVPNSWRTGSYVGLGLGAAGVATAIGFSIHALAVHRGLQDECVGSRQQNNGCLIPASASQRVDRYQRSANIANGSLALGIVSLLSGGAMWLLANKQDAAAQYSAKLSIQPFVGVNSAGITGQF